MNKKISFLQVFGILLVVLGHSNNSTGDSLYIVDYLHNWIYSFHMPLFMFISGYLLKYTSKQKLSKIEIFSFTKKKVMRLIFPFIIISSLAYIPKFLLGKFAQRPLDLTLKSYIHGIIYPWDNPIIFFWFLPTLLLVMLLVIFLMKILKDNMDIVMLISLILSLFLSKIVDIKILNINGVLNYIFFFTLGIYYECKEEIIDNFLRKNLKWGLLLSFIILLINPLLRVLEDIKIYYLIIAVIGIIFSILLSFIYSDRDYKFFNHLNGKSYSIYLLSWFPQVFVRILGYQILDLSEIVVLPISFILGTYIPYVINLITLEITRRYKKLKLLKILIGA